MNTSKIYHGGSGKPGFSSMGSGGTPPASGERYTLNYGTIESISVNSMVNPPAENGYYQSGGQGYYIPYASHIKEFSVNFSQILSYSSSSSCTLQLKHLTADGAYGFVLNSSAQGTNLYNLVTTFPHTGGIFRFFRGNANTALNIAIAAGEMLFITCCSMNVTALDGVSCWVTLEKD